jgi:hypothetical protein
MPTIRHYGNAVQTVFETPGCLSRKVYVDGVLTTPSSVTAQSVTLGAAPASMVPVQIDYEVAPPLDADDEYRTTTTAAFTVPDGVSKVILAGSGTVPVTLPELPLDGQTISIVLETAHTAVSVAASAAHTIVAGAALAVTAGVFATFRYRASNAKWYRVG